MIGFFTSSTATDIGVASSEAMFSLSSELKSSFFRGESLTFKFSRVEAA
jgi:hypothetical protein